MAIQHTLDALINELTRDEAAELAALVKAWPNNDTEIQRLVEENFYELLDVIRSSGSASQGGGDGIMAEREHYSQPSSLAGSLLPTPGSC